MSENDNQESTIASNLCKNGCGFYGSTQFDGMCSVCHKENLKKKQKQDEEQIHTNKQSPNAYCATSAALAESLLEAAGVQKKPSADAEPTPLEAGAQPTVPITTKDNSTDSDTNKESVCAVAADEPSNKKKRNRCGVCKKKVGLTGFDCRCGGLYCSVHRYSDKHQCEFDYQSLGQDQIRKANPQVVSSKVEKL